MGLMICLALIISMVEGARPIKIEQSMQGDSGKIFNMALGILKAKGEEKGLLFLKHKVYRGIDESRKPSVTFEIKAGNNLGRARQVTFSIEGEDTLYLSKR